MIRHRTNALVYGPVIALLIIGVIAYIITVKLTTPDIPLLQAEQQSSPAAQLTTIQTTVTKPSAAQVEQWQQAAKTETWRLDPLQTAQHLAPNYGFSNSDSFNQPDSDVDTVIVTHSQQQYQFVMYQPGNTGSDGVWYIKSITQQ
jgi:hypothetical protein